jgi:flagellar P-ring protein precursor FlgI
MLQIAFIVLFCLMSSPAVPAVRIKDITTLQGVRENQIVGYGLVVGLQGTGDSLTNSIFTAQSLQSMLDRMGINIRGNARGQIVRTRNIAAVLVTAELPAFIQPGSRIDVTVSSLGDATSLLGGTLVLTALTGIDGQTYAFA